MLVYASKQRSFWQVGPASEAAFWEQQRTGGKTNEAIPVGRASAGGVPMMASVERQGVLWQGVDRALTGC